MGKLKDEVNINNHDNYIVFNEGGIGKTMQMKEMFCELSLSRREGILPIYVDCKTLDFTYKKPLLTKVLFDFCGNDCRNNYTDSLASLENMLTKPNEKYKLVFFIDALNECESNKYSVIKDIVTLLESPTNKIIVSSRINEDNSAFKGFKRLKVEEFSDEQIIKYLDSKGFKENGESIQLDKLNASLLKILRLPMFLKLFTDTYSPDNLFPDMYTSNIVRKSDLMQFFLNKILNEKKEQHGSDLAPEYIKRKFALERYLPALAYEMNSIQRLSITEDELSNLIDNKFNYEYFKRLAGLRERRLIRVGISEDLSEIVTNEFSLLNISDDRYAFSHQVWQDFFCGKFLSLCIKYDVLEPFEKNVSESVRQFIGEIIGEYKFESKKDVNSPMSPVETFMQKHNLQSTAPLSAAATANLIEIMKTSRNNSITGIYDELDLLKTYFSRCDLQKSTFNRARLQNLNNEITFSYLSDIIKIPDTNTFYLKELNKIFKYNLTDNKLETVHDDYFYIRKVMVADETHIIFLSDSLYLKNLHTGTLSTLSHSLSSIGLSDICEHYCAVSVDKDLFILDIYTGETIEIKEVLRAAYSFFDIQKEKIVKDVPIDFSGIVLRLFFINGHTLVCGDADNIFLYDIEAKEFKRYVQIKIRSVWVLTADRRYFVSANGIYKTDTFERVIPLNLGLLNSIKISESGRYIAFSCFFEDSICVYDTEKKEFVLKTDIVKAPNYEFSENENELLFCGINGELALLDIYTNTIKYPSVSQFGVISPKNVKNKQGEGVFVSNGYDVRFIDLLNPFQTKKVAFNASIKNVSFDGKYFTTDDSGNEIVVRSSDEPNMIVSKLTYKDYNYEQTIFSPKNYTCLSIIGDSMRQSKAVIGEIIQWNTMTGKILNKFRVGCSDVFYFNSGDKIAVIENSSIIVMRSEDFRVIKSISFDSDISRAAVSDDDTLLYIAFGNRIEVFDTDVFLDERVQCVEDIKQHVFNKEVKNKIYDIALIDKRYIAVTYYFNQTLIDIFDITDPSFNYEYRLFDSSIVGCDFRNAVYNGKDKREFFLRLYQNGGIVPEEYIPKFLSEDNR